MTKRTPRKTSKIIKDYYENNEGQSLKLRTNLKPKTKNQEDYIRTISENDLTIVTGPAGSGKTHIAIGLACEYLSLGKIDKIILTRPLVTCGKGLGYLPGDLKEKVDPYMIPLLDEMEIFFYNDAIKDLIEEGKIQIIPLELLRGRNFHRSFMILDETQNASFEQMKMFISRMGVKSKCVLSGDIKQTDLIKNDLSFLIDKLGELNGFGYSMLSYEDIQRSGFVGRFLTRLES